MDENSSTGFLKKYITVQSLTTNLVFGALVCWYLFWLLTPVNMFTADLGRHTMNGRVLWHDWSQGGQAVLFSNYYSFTNPDFPVINHHWGSGLLFFAADSIGGIIGVQIMFIVISVAAYGLFVDTSIRLSTMRIVAPLAFLLTPLIAARVEVRPEAISYFMIGLYLWLLWRNTSSRAPRRWLWLLPVAQILWANTHIYFIFGIYITALWFLGQLWYRWRQQKTLSRAWIPARPYAVTTIAVVVASLGTPFGWRGVWYPFTMFQNYGYQIVENKSIMFLEAWGMENPHFFVIKILTVLLVFSLIRTFLRRPKTLPVPVIALTFLVLSWLAIRNFTIAGLTTIPALAVALQSLPWRRLSDDQMMRRGLYVVGLCLVAAFFYLQYGGATRQQWERKGIGPIPNATALSQFIDQAEVPQPMFNNYDIGGYLTYYHWPQYPVFVDNRPEAYPTAFFTEQYVPMQQDESIWQSQVQRYNLQSIVFWRHDLTPWAQQFLANRITDTTWVPIYLDDYAIVFIRNDEANRSLIDRFDLRQ